VTPEQILQSLETSASTKMADDDDWMNDDISIAVPTAPEV
jgi:hypothetical protein